MGGIIGFPMAQKSGAGENGDPGWFILVLLL